MKTIRTKQAFFKKNCLVLCTLMKELLWEQPQKSKLKNYRANCKKETPTEILSTESEP